MIGIFQMISPSSKVIYLITEFPRLNRLILSHWIKTCFIQENIFVFARPRGGFAYKRETEAATMTDRQTDREQFTFSVSTWPQQKTRTLRQYGGSTIPEPKVTRLG